MHSKLLHEEKVFKDPVHGYIHVRDRLIWDLIGTREFQRLRRIRQLGTTYLTFHGAEHSRFNHSLGVYEIVRRMMTIFQGRPYWNDEERLLCLTAALLHDVGHGPFSHSFEKVFDFNHEEWSRNIITGNTEINQVLRSVDDTFPQAVADVIAKKYPNPLVVSLISSQIDADRMDYLLRDAYYTGVSYGKFDLDRVLRVMRPYPGKIVIKESGMHAVEDYLVRRYQMYWQVYFHPVTRSAEVILTKILHRVKDLYEQGFSFQTAPVHFLPFFHKTVTLDDYITLDESFIYYYLEMWQKEKDSILQDLCRRFLNRHLFKYVDFEQVAPTDRLEEIKQLCAQCGIDPNYYIVKDSSSDLPYDFYRPDKEKRVPIYLLKRNGDLQELSKASPIVESLTGKVRTDVKLYFPHDLLEDFRIFPQEKARIFELLYRSE
ncbi:HD domain-containing protein [Massilibacterium senegalense]|uniref:HD domain-containing protein n=1 Tax=Massilibacterium senegalense TaxID=1632858 RepID=UPI000782BD04|nr:HD domain-containing protein [Massilibacterium senegalense]